MTVFQKLCKNFVFNTSENICFGYFIESYLWQQIYFNGNVFGNKCCRCNEVSLFLSSSATLRSRWRQEQWNFITTMHTVIYSYTCTRNIELKHRGRSLKDGHVCITKTRLFKYIENFTSKNWKFSDKKTLTFFIFLLKTRLWVLVRTASLRRF